MAGFSPEWLALREPADHEARNLQLLSSVGSHFAGRGSLSIVDLGCGAGSNLRGSYAAFPARQHWTLVDADEALLAVARTELAAWADEAREQGEELILTKADRIITVDVRRADLDSELEWVLGWRPDLVTAAALFDLVSKRWIERFVAALTGLGIPLYTVLTVDGREDWPQEAPRGDRVLSAFAAHQRRDKGFGPAEGPAASDAMAEAFRKSGFAVSTADSSWRLGRDRAALIAELARGVAAAAGETGQLDPADIAAWLAGSETAATVRIGHTDLWARPV